MDTTLMSLRVAVYDGLCEALTLLALYDADHTVRADALPRQTDHQTCELLLCEYVLLWFAASVRPDELSLVQPSRCQPDTDSVVNQYLQAIGSPVGEQLGMVRVRSAE